MPGLDIRTLIVVTIFLAVGSTVALFALWRSQSRHNGAGLWAAGMGCISGAGILISGRGVFPDFLSVVIADTVYAMGFLFILRGIRVFTGRPPLRVLDWGMPPFVAAFCFYFTYTNPSINATAIVISFAFVVITFAIALTLVREKKAPWRSSGLAVATVFGLFGVTQGARISMVLLAPLEQPFMQSGVASSMTVLVGIFLIGGGTISLILLAHSALEAEFRILSSAVTQSASSIMITDRTGTIQYVNPAFKERTGYSPEKVIGKNPRILQSGETKPEAYASLWKTITAGEAWRGEFHNRKKNGELFWEIASIAPVKQKDGRISHFIGVKEDITALKDAEECIRHLATHDTLTGLPTRSLLMDRLLSAVANARRNKTKVAVMFIDLDSFKMVNDTLGHESGDYVLVETAARLRSCVREVDTVARIGGDEFLIVLSDVRDKAGVSKVAKKVIDEVAKPYKLELLEPAIGVSIGIALYPDHGDDTKTLIKMADQAMYKIKRQGKNNYAFAD